MRNQREETRIQRQLCVECQFIEFVNCYFEWVPRFSSLIAYSSGDCSCCAQLAQADPMLQVVGETSPQHFHLHFLQAPYMELPQPQLALDPCVTKLHDSSSATVLFAGFFASHLLAKRNHHWAFSNCATERPCFLGLSGQHSVCERSFGNFAGLLQEMVTSSRPQFFARHLAECRTFPPGKYSGSSPADREMRSAETGSASLRRVRRIFLSHGLVKIDFSLGHLLDIFSRGVAAIGHHLSRFLFEPLFHAIHGWQVGQLPAPVSQSSASLLLPQSAHMSNRWKSGRCS